MPRPLGWLALGSAAIATLAVPASAVAAVALDPPPPTLDLLLDADGQYDGATADARVGQQVELGAFTARGATDMLLAPRVPSSLRVIAGTPLGLHRLGDPQAGLLIDVPVPSPSVIASNAGDIDGDGLDDMIARSWFTSTVHVVLGRASQADRIGAASPGVIEIVATGRTLKRVAGVGDVDGDGLDDLAVVSSGGAGRFRVDVVRSTAGVTDIDVASPGLPGFRITSTNDLSEVYPAGDLNDDGRADIAVPVGANRLAIVFGSATTLPVALGALGSAGFIIEGRGADGLGDVKVAPAGDIDGDGIDDLALGAYHDGTEGHEGTAYVVFGRRGAPTRLDLDELGSRGIRIDGPDSEAGYAQFGISLAAGADLTGDGKPDLAIGAPYVAEGGREGQGAVYVVSLRSTGNVDVSRGRFDGVRIDGPTRDASIGVGNGPLEHRLALAPGRLLIGVPDADPSGFRDAGSVFVIDRLGTPAQLPLSAVACEPFVPAARGRGAAAPARAARAAGVRLRARRTVRLRLVLLRATPGRRTTAGGPCRPGRAGAGAHRCLVRKRVRVTTRRVVAGRTARLPLAAVSRRLPAGRYILRVRATDAAGRTFGPWRLAFRIR